MNYLSGFLMTKNENRYLREWVAFHRTQGFTKFYIYDNMSSVPVSETLAREIKNGIVEVKIWSETRRGKHNWAMNDCLARKDIHTTWISMTDTDEFIYGENEKLVDLLRRKEKEGVPALKFKWRGFGYGGHEKRPEGLVLENFLFRGDYDDWPLMGGPHPVGKSVVRFGVVKGMGSCHDPAGVDPELVREEFYINHYVTRSKDEFAEKTVRGGGNGVKRGAHLFNIYNKNLNKYEDKNIHRWLDETKKFMEET
jgi:hypothetical protein